MSKKSLIIILILIIANIGFGFVISKTYNRYSAANSEFLNTKIDLENKQEVLKSENNKLEGAKKRQNKIGNFDSASITNALDTSEMQTGTETQAPTSNISVCIDAGHGITSRNDKEPVSPGSSTKKASNVSGTDGEEPVNLSIALKLRDELQKSGITVDMIRTTHECSTSNVERAEQANNSDYCIRIHCDGIENSSTNGLSILVPEKSYYGDNDFVRKSNVMANCILTSVISATGAKNNGITTRSDLTGFNWSKVPVVLIECGFMSNPSERAKLESDEYQSKLAKGIAEGFLNYVRG